MINLQMFIHAFSWRSLNETISRLLKRIGFRGRLALLGGLVPSFVVKMSTGSYGLSTDKIVRLESILSLIGSLPFDLIRNLLITEDVMCPISGSFRVSDDPPTLVFEDNWNDVRVLLKTGTQEMPFAVSSSSIRWVLSGNGDGRGLVLLKSRSAAILSLSLESDQESKLTKLCEKVFSEPSMIVNLPMTSGPADTMSILKGVPLKSVKPANPSPRRVRFWFTDSQCLGLDQPMNVRTTFSGSWYRTIIIGQTIVGFDVSGFCHALLVVPDNLVHFQPQMKSWFGFDRNAYLKMRGADHGVLQKPFWSFRDCVTGRIGGTVAQRLVEGTDARSILAATREALVRFPPLKKVSLGSIGRAGGRMLAVSTNDFRGSESPITQRRPVTRCPQETSQCGHSWRDISTRGNSLDTTKPVGEFQDPQGRADIINTQSHDSQAKLGSEGSGSSSSDGGKPGIVGSVYGEAILSFLFVKKYP